MESDCPGVTTFLVIWTGIHNLYRESLTEQLRTADVHVNASYGRWPQDFWL